MMDMDEIQTFIVLASCRNFTKAAEILHVVQSTVSNRIRSLEEYVGTPLVLRYKSGIHLTAEGETFLSYANQIYAIKQKSLQEIHMMKKFRDHLKVGCVRWMYDQWLEDMLVQFHFRFPDISLHIDIEHSENMIPMLQHKLLDMAFISYEINNGSVASIPFKSVDVVFTGAAEKFGSLSDGISKLKLLELPLIYSDIWENYLEKVSKHMLSGGMVFPVHSNMLDSAKAFCLAGAGCCFLPRAMLEQELRAGTLVEIPILDLPVHSMDTYIAYQRQRMDSEALKSWISFYKENS